MAKQILVALKRGERVETIIPYVERIGQPGAKVIFLVPYPVDPENWWRSRRLSIEAEIQRALTVRTTEGYPWEKQRQLAKDRLFPAYEALHKMGVEVILDVYQGPIRRAVKSYTRNGDVQLIMMPAGMDLRMKRLLYGTVALFGLIRRPGFVPVLSFHPRPQA